MKVLGMTTAAPAPRAHALAVAMACLLALFGLATSTTARADEPNTAADPEPEVSDQQRLWGRLLAVELQGAIDGPLGVAGGTLIISPIAHLGLEIGGGVSRDGGRFAGGFRIMLPQDHFAVQLRMGVAAGPLTWDGTAETDGGTSYGVRRRWEFQAGMYADIGLQYRFDFGLYLGLNGGVEGSFTGTADNCSVTSEGAGLPNTCNVEGFRPIRIYLGLQVGYAFDILL